MANIKELKETIEKAIIEFSKENEVDNMNVHVTIQKKIKCNMVGSVLDSWLEAETEINIK
jgi:hypothetical protein